MANTPPQRSKDPPAQQSTPIKGNTLSSTLMFTTNHFKRDERMKQVGKDMGRKYVGPVHPSDFLDKFLPQKAKRISQLTKELKTKLSEVSAQKQEPSAYPVMITALEEACGDSLVLIDTHNHADNVAWGHQSELIKPDLIAYSPSYNPEVQKDLRINDITRAEFFWEFKLAESCDGFDDLGIQEEEGDGTKGEQAGEVVDEDDDAYEERESRCNRRYFEKRTKSARDTRNQMATYAGAILSSQFRTHLFSIQVTRTRARLIRWDREGAIVSNAFPFAEEPFLVEFVKRFAKAERDYRGHDSCVTEVEPAFAKEVREVLRDNNDSNRSEEAYRVYKFTFPNERARGEPVTFYGGKVAFEGNACPTGRSTRGFLVVDKDNKKFYLKDTWRISKQGMVKEGDVYKILEEKKVEKIPGVVACGDASGKWQETVTGSFSKRHDAKRRPHHHYFIVLDIIGRRLTDFRTLGELLNAMKDALQAHYEACTKANILHRDISVGNILITEGGGVLIDWDFSRAFDVKEIRQPERTGTWQFMSARLLMNQNPPVPHLIEDDLEAFYHVVCYMFWKYCQHQVDIDGVKDIMERVFDWAYGTVIKGGDNKWDRFRSRSMAGARKLGRLGKQTAIISLIIAVEEVFGVVRYDDPPSAQALDKYREAVDSNPSQLFLHFLQNSTEHMYETHRHKLETTKWLWERFCEATAGNSPELEDGPVYRNLYKPQGKTGNLHTKSEYVRGGDQDIEDRPAKKQRSSQPSQPTAGPSRSGSKSNQPAAGSSRSGQHTYSLRSGSGRR